MEWQPIESAPDDEVVFVGWIDEEGMDRHDFDCKEDGVWQRHEESVQYADAVAPRDIPCKMPNEVAPYTHWMKIYPLPEPPAD